MPPRRSKKAKKLNDSTLDTRLVKALSHPIRARALAILNERVASPKEIAEELGGDVGNVGYHVKTLYELGCVELVDEVPRRGATEHFYRGTTRSFLNDENWARLYPDAKDGVSIAGLKMINDTSREALQAKTFDSRSDRHLSCTPVTIDEEGWGELSALLAETLEGVLEIQARSAGRQADRPTETLRATVSILGFESPQSTERSGG
jgi:DNA-binding transcriptional ArsR family regulator